MSVVDNLECPADMSQEDFKKLLDDYQQKKQQEKELATQLKQIRTWLKNTEINVFTQMKRKNVAEIEMSEPVPALLSKPRPIKRKIESVPAPDIKGEPSETPGETQMVMPEQAPVRIEVTKKPKMEVITKVKKSSPYTKSHLTRRCTDFYKGDDSKGERLFQFLISDVDVTTVEQLSVKKGRCKEVLDE